MGAAVGIHLRRSNGEPTKLWQITTQSTPLRAWDFRHNTAGTVPVHSVAAAASIARARRAYSRGGIPICAVNSRLKCA